MKLLSLEPESSASANSAIPAKKMVGRDGFEPSKSVTADLQSAPFGHSGTYPHDVAFPATMMELAMGLEPATC